MAQGDLNTTSYVILGLLVSRDWTAYEISVQFGRGVGELWPRADRQLYNAPKKLLERGLVSATTDAADSGRSRTVYSITDTGRDALSSWLATESKPSALQFEGMIRVLFAEQGSLDDLRANITTMRDQAQQTRSLFLSHAERLLDVEHSTFPDRQHLMTLANRFMVGHFTHISEWADWALTETETWSDTKSPATTHREQSRTSLEESLQRHR
ncbi:PadR family transcriptional regulator [Rhodococcus sp. P1Y]|uniref:PadR family transcriptional regulator n=1 Tax=Rhodococcus sp. P1Y TaxID=1302308 RepID=UPI000EB3A0BA|nr:PadR family transcriptional regulator [Rhodococcus sp. P1Y]AYJ48384.1 PadR family transcriptional regulator [Rhodococcus sp. P1Y]